MSEREIMDVIQELEDKHIAYRDECSLEDQRAYYSNQSVVIALEDLKSRIRRIFKDKQKSGAAKE